MFNDQDTLEFKPMNEQWIVQAPVEVRRDDIEEVVYHPNGSALVVINKGRSYYICDWGAADAVREFIRPVTVGNPLI